jgi:periplasmic protein TonB
MVSPRFLMSLLAVIGLHVALLMPWRMPLNHNDVISASPSMSVRMLALEEGGAAPSVRPGVTAPAALPSPIDMSPVPVVAPTERDRAEALAAELAVLQTAGTRAAPPVRAATAADAMALNRPAAAVQSELTASRQDAKSSLTEPGALPPAPSYFAAGSLDPGPKPLSDINPDYPARAGQQQGVVVLRLLINEQGVVDNVAVVRATPLGYFEESALEAFGKALFSPGKLLGVSVKSQITIEVEFMPINRGATVSGRTY